MKDTFTHSTLTFLTSQGPHCQNVNHLQNFAAEICGFDRTANKRGIYLSDVFITPSAIKQNITQPNFGAPCGLIERYKRARWFILLRGTWAESTSGLMCKYHSNSEEGSVNDRVRFCETLLLQGTFVHVSHVHFRSMCKDAYIHCLPCK